jgi:hypothetical protein
MEKHNNTTKSRNKTRGNGNKQNRTVSTKSKAITSNASNVSFQSPTDGLSYTR